MSNIIIAVLSNIHGLIKSRRLRWVGHVARMGENIDALQMLVDNFKERQPRCVLPIYNIK
jgi:hypothetical protein